MARLVLFDIDGTLIRGGPAKEAFGWGLQHAFGTMGPIDDHSFAGKTDPQIAQELMQLSGVDTDTVFARLPTAFQAYLARMRTLILRQPVEVLPGVRETISSLRDDQEYALGVLTGNIYEGARLKLNSADLWSHFPIGAFGSDAGDRDDLPPFALRRAKHCWRQEYAPSEGVIIGDTPRDIACAKCHGLRSIAVTAGSYDATQLAGADVILPDLRALKPALEAL